MGRLLDAIMDLVFLLGVVWTVSKSIRGLMGGARRGSQGGGSGERKRPPKTVQGRTVRDPVCGMFVSTEVSERLVQGSEVLHFCSKRCREEYEKGTARI